MLRVINQRFIYQTASSSLYLYSFRELEKVDSMNKWTNVSQLSHRKQHKKLLMSMTNCAQLFQTDLLCFFHSSEFCLAAAKQRAQMLFFVKWQSFQLIAHLNSPIFTFHFKRYIRFAAALNHRLRLLKRIGEKMMSKDLFGSSINCCGCLSNYLTRFGSRETN